MNDNEFKPICGFFETVGFVVVAGLIAAIFGVGLVTIILKIGALLP
jgi:hypothetical protein